MPTNLGNYSVPNDTKNGICFDIGANYGDFTANYLSHFDKIYFVEPQIDLFNKVKDRFKDNAHVIGLNLAVWSEPNVELEMVAHPNTDFGSVGVKGNFTNQEWTNTIVNKTKSITIEEIYNLVDNNIIDYMKIDCETSEYPFLYGKDLSKIKYIGIELHNQLGLEKYNQLLGWIKNTHVLTHGNDEYVLANNKEVLFKLV